MNELNRTTMFRMELRDVNTGKRSELLSSLFDTGVDPEICRTFLSGFDLPVDCLDDLKSADGQDAGIWLTARTFDRGLPGVTTMAGLVRRHGYELVTTRRDRSDLTGVTAETPGYIVAALEFAPRAHGTDAPAEVTA